MTGVDDPSALRALETSLPGGEEIYRRLVEISPDAITLTDLSMKVILCNNQAARLHGYECAEKMIGASVLRGIAPEDRERALKNARKTLEVESVSNVEYTLLKTDGTRFPVELSASVIMDAAGNPSAFIAIVRDISERKEAEKALRASEERYRSLYLENPTMYFTVDPAGDVLSVNQFGAEQLGYTIEELVGRPVLNVFYEEDKAAVSRQLEECLKHRGRVAHWEFRKVRKDGEVIWVKEAARAAQDSAGNVIVLVVCEDISEQKRTQEALRASEERYRALYQANPTMYFTVDANGMVLSVNEFGAEQLGYSIDELVGRPVLDVFYEEDKQTVRGQLEACLKMGGKVAHWEFRKVRKDGEVIWVKEAARATQDIDGKTVVLVVCEDITEQKRVEEQLQAAREELESRVERQILTSNTYGLTFRELTVLHLVAGGKADKEIATLLGISSLTVNKHVANLRHKMGASSRTEAGVRALKEGLVG